MSEDCDADQQVEFMELVTPNQSRLFGYIYTLVCNSNDAHDVYQQTIMVLWKKFHTFQRGTNFTAWAFRTAKLECMAFHRKNNRDKYFFDGQLVDQIATDQQIRANDVQMDRTSALESCLKKLNDRDSKLLNECYRRGAGLGQAAKKLGRSAQSLSNSLRRIRMSLHRCISNLVAQGGTP